MPNSSLKMHPLSNAHCRMSLSGEETFQKSLWTGLDISLEYVQRLSHKFIEHQAGDFNHIPDSVFVNRPYSDKDPLIENLSVAESANSFAKSYERTFKSNLFPPSFSSAHPSRSQEPRKKLNSSDGRGSNKWRLEDGECVFRAHLRIVCFEGTIKLACSSRRIRTCGLSSIPSWTNRRTIS